MATSTLFSATESDGTAGKLVLKPEDLILFQGDSITDVERERHRQKMPNDGRAMGHGYPFHVTGELLAEYGDLNLQVYNRGISGDTITHLDRRWKRDTLELKPSVLSILIGANDIWGQVAGGRFKGTAESYREEYAALLTRTRQALPDVQLVVCEPFILKCGYVTDEWYPLIDTYREYARQVAADAGAILVPFQEALDKAMADSGTGPEYWVEDGVHPSMAGHALMAKTWREAVGV